VIFLVVTMGRLDAEAKTTMSFLMRKGQSKSEVARLLGVTEGTVRYHAKRKAAGAVDGHRGHRGVSCLDRVSSPRLARGSAMVHAGGWFHALSGGGGP
jgi:predicted transcriptional regulator